MAIKLPSLTSLVIPEWLKLLWKIGPFVIIGVLSLTVHEKNWQIHDLRQTAKLESKVAEAANSAKQAEWASNKSDAIETLSLAFANKQPVIQAQIKDTQRYAQTPDGMSSCLPADRMQSLADERKALEAASAAARAKRPTLPEADHSAKGPQ